MPVKNKPEATNINNNHNTNNVNVNVKVEQPRKKISPTPKKTKPNWYTRTIVGGLIALALSLCGYYIKKNMDAKSNGTLKVPSNTQKIEGIKQ